MTKHVMRIMEGEAKPDDIGKFYYDTGCPIVIGDNVFSVINTNGTEVYFETLESIKEYLQGE